MKKIFKTILKYYLKFLAKLVLLRYRPTVIAVAGSINKGFVKDEIAKAIAAKGFSVRASEKNFNTDIGLPLAILGLPSGYGSYRAWLCFMPALLKSVWQKSLPEFLVLDFGVSDPGDMAYLLSIVRPDIVVITDITQRYLEGFEGMDHLVGEYEYLVKSLRSKDVLVLNSDNSRVLELSKLAKSKINTFGFAADADNSIAEVIKKPNGLSVIYMTSEKERKELDVKKFGTHNALAAVAGDIIKTYL